MRASWATAPYDGARFKVEVGFTRSLGGRGGAAMDTDSERIRWTRGTGMTPVLLSLIMDMDEAMLETERLFAPGSENESRLSRVSEL